jgi:hypothetical protein
MKKLIILVVLLQNLAFGQYQSLFSDSITTWDIMEDRSNLDDPQFPMYRLSIDHDTIDVNGDTMYYIVGTSNYQPNYPNENFFAKQNSDHSKAWVKKNYNDTTWSLFYDLTLTVGETIQSTAGSFNTSLSEVDSVYFDIQNRKHIRCNQNTFISGKFEFIEGVGTSYGLFRTNIYNPSRKPTLICQHKSGVLNYSLIHPLVANCQTSLGTDELTVSSLEISPNPSNDWIVISSENTLQWETITIMNTIGQIVSSAPYTSEPINISGYEKGMYMLILANSKMSVKERFVKQ